MATDHQVSEHHATQLERQLGMTLTALIVVALLGQRFGGSCVNLPRRASARRTQAGKHETCEICRSLTTQSIANI